MRDRYNVDFPNLSWIFKDHKRLLAFGFGSGLIRPFSGTWGTLFAWILWFCLLKNLDDGLLFIFLVIGFVYGCIICQHMDNELKIHDHVGIVFDEIISFIFVLWVINGSFYLELLSFLLFRFFDIAKPVPIKYLDSVFKGGFGIMIDDLIAAIYTIIAILLII